VVENKIIPCSDDEWYEEELLEIYTLGYNDYSLKDIWEVHHFKHHSFKQDVWETQNKWLSFKHCVTKCLVLNTIVLNKISEKWIHTLKFAFYREKF